MKPKPREIDYEKVAVGEFINGVIKEIQHDENHKSTYQGKERISDCVRLKFQLEGYKHPHYSRWMTFTYGEKSSLYLKYLVKLVANAQPNMDFDIELLKGFKVKTVWAEQNDFQSIESIFPSGTKLGETHQPSSPIKESESPLEPSLEPPEEEVPF